MKIKYQSIASVTGNPVEEATKRISKSKATILSRLHGEVVAIIPSNRHDDPTMYWVWLSSAEGAYMSKTGTAEEFAKTIVYGEWTFQPNAHMVLESNEFAKRIDPNV